VNDDKPTSGLFEELKRRKVFRVAVMYAGIAWIVIEVASTVLPTFNVPERVLQVLTVLLILGLPVAVVLAGFSG
jgi:adenylate cyclase